MNQEIYKDLLQNHIFKGQKKTDFPPKLWMGGGSRVLNFLVKI